MFFENSLILFNRRRRRYKTFSSSLTLMPNKLECLFLAYPIQSSLIFEGKPKASPKVTNLKLYKAEKNSY